MYRWVHPIVTKSSYICRIFYARKLDIIPKSCITYVKLKYTVQPCKEILENLKYLKADRICVLSTVNSSYKYIT